MSSITPLDIAAAMKSMGWPVASALMTRWCNGAPWTMPDPVKQGKTNPTSLPVAQYDDTTVNMSWLMKFPRAKAAKDLVFGKALNPPAITVLKKRLTDAGWKSGATLSLGNTSMDARTLEWTCQTNFAQLGGFNDTIDEFYGAIGKASFKVAVVGTATVVGKQNVFNVDKVGVYLRDTYDFTDDGFISQPLGIWSKKRILTKAESGIYAADKAARLVSAMARLLPHPYPGFEPISNSDFDDWRTKNSKGGDFVIYSDVLWLSPTVAQVVLPP